MTDEQPKPKGKRETREYRVLVFVASGDAEATWVDCGPYAGHDPKAAIKRARQDDPELRRAVAEGNPVVGIPVGHFRPLRVTIETVEREAFRAVDVS